MMGITLQSVGVFLSTGAAGEGIQSGACPKAKLQLGPEDPIGPWIG